ncbi:ABC-three component system protein [Photobacterium chitinilyticum]|uniref:ABC-three component systems C-terminal domain-containing protein n=1 Tax=Photobacterium chitinilyticum TaxID=2485123 RepID=A0A3S3UIL7_9GAMM|nr:ABC-three component system protein [Photobacterium chitinilyticum]RWX54858.1 hypothetical protein EDI28_14020 [Photobacterium chitinilyticum]
MSNVNLVQVLTGASVLPIHRIKLFSPEEWEEFVEEWLTFKELDYIEVERLGGAGDKGRDVIGYVTCPKTNPDSYVWDNFQCKHYDHALRPSDVWTEFGKVCYYTYLGDFPVPRHYYFIAPYGVGTSLADLLRKPDILRQELKDNWDKYCKFKITKKMPNGIELTGAFLDYVDQFDFSIFLKVKPLTLIEEHSNTRYHISRFGGGLPERTYSDDMPEEVTNQELVYVTKLFAAYSDADGNTLTTLDCIASKKKYLNHFKRARKCFYKTEQLKHFSRDKLPAGVYESYQNEIASGVINVVEDDHEHGFQKVKEVEQEARKLAITSNPLTLCSDGDDRAGVCHHLANDPSDANEFIWIEYD